MSYETTVKVAGAIFQDEIPAEDYRDFLCATFGMEDIRYGLKLGNFPPGLIFEDHTGKHIVRGVYKKPNMWLGRFIV